MAFHRSVFSKKSRRCPDGQDVKSLSAKDWLAFSYFNSYLQVDDPQVTLDRAFCVGRETILRPMEKVSDRSFISASDALPKKILGRI